MSDFDVFPPRPAQPRQAASQKRDEPSHFESLVDDTEPKAKPERADAAPARETKDPAAPDAPASAEAPAATPAETAQPDAAAASGETADAPAEATPATLFLTALLDAMAPGETDADTDAGTTDTADTTTDPQATAPAQPVVPAVTAEAVAAPVLALLQTDGAAIAGEDDTDAAKPAAAATTPDPLAALANAAPKKPAPAKATADNAAGDTAPQAQGETAENADTAILGHDTVQALKHRDGASGEDGKDEASETAETKPKHAASDKTETRPLADDLRPAPGKPDSATPQQPQPVVASHHAAAADATAASRPAEQAVPVTGIAVEIAAQARAGKNRFEIRLDPPELGRIDVRLDIDRDGKVTSRLTVDRVETLDILRRDAHSIERALNDAGLKTSDSALQFSLRDQGFAQRDSSGDGDNKGARLVAADAELSATAAAPIYNRLPGLGGGLDIRV
jgi:flagellar hook-length control protein FliK